MQQIVLTITKRKPWIFISIVMKQEKTVIGEGSESLQPDGSENMVLVQMVQKVLWSVLPTKMQPWFLNPGVDTSFPHT